MLEEIVKHVELMPKEAVLEQIKKELIEAVVNSAVPKKWTQVQQRLTELERFPAGRPFQFHAVNFILWLNGVGGNVGTFIPQPAVFRDSDTLIKYLPYSKYIVKLAGKTIKIFPQHGTDQPISPEMAQAILRQASGKEYVKEIYVLHEGEMCQLMWVNEDGMASIKISRDGYQVKPLKEILEAE
jgi:hypothetical protein